MVVEQVPERERESRGSGGQADKIGDNHINLQVAITAALSLGPLEARRPASSLQRVHSLRETKQEREKEGYI